MSDIDPSRRPAGKVAAVVVTRNRIAMLRECVHALRQQTCPVGEVIVVDNDSSDGTREWLNQQPDIRAIFQENAGGAGGFHVGIGTAISRGFEWVWCMDDDGYPSADCLQALLSIPQDTLRFRAPVVLARGNASLLAFVLR